MPPKQANCPYCGEPFLVGWVRNKHMKLCVVLTADTQDVTPEIIDVDPVRAADEQHPDNDPRPVSEVRAEENVQTEDAAHAEVDEMDPEHLTTKEHKAKRILSPHLMDIIQFFGACSRGLPMPQSNVNHMLHYVKRLPGRAGTNLPKTSKTAWRILTTVSYVEMV